MPTSPKVAGSILAVVAVLVAAAWVSFGAVERYFLGRLASQNEGTLRLVEAGLDGSLRRYDPLPGLIADKQAVRLMLADPARTDGVSAVNGELKRIAAEVGASDIYVMDHAGLTIAASNFDLDRSFIGRNFSFRPYFTGAAAGKPTRFFALGTTSLKRGYYFSAPVHDDGRTIGVVALKIEVEELEDNWRGAEARAIVCDDHGVIFMASEPAWLFKSLEPLGEAALRQIESVRQYPVEQLGALDMRVEPSGIDGAVLRTMGAGGETFLSSERDMPAAGWTLHVLTPAAVATGQAVTAMAVACLAALLVALVAGIVMQRRRRLIIDIEQQRRGREELERRVEERTRDLRDANRLLKREVSERTHAEQQLRSTQNELIQAGKLAALGQMSASLSHELNQPLAAIKAYAENARTFLKRDKAHSADDNIGRISEMVDRMAELGNHLRNFARRPKQKIDVVDLADVFTAVSQIIGARLKRSGATLDIAPMHGRIKVMGGSVRLQQVIINLIGNALDAMAGVRAPTIDIAVTPLDGMVEIAVRDHGPGIDPAILEQIFDPFFTTKPVNEGLGLGLSISFNIVQDFGGGLEAANHPGGGAVFTIRLIDADAVRSAAE
ncbi:MAG: ATP-binding protein [Rhizobiaceae bacterium]